MNFTLKPNEHIKNLLISADNLYKGATLSGSQVEWKLENQDYVLGLIGKDGFFGRRKMMIIHKNKDGNYQLLSPREKSDKYPNYLYDIVDLEEFCKQVPVRAFLFGDERDAFLDEIRQTLETTKMPPSVGYIETNEEGVFVFELDMK